MPLVKSPRLTPAKLNANRANARRSTGPRSPRGKAHCALNALRHGRYAGPGFRQRLAAQGGDVGLYDWVLAQVRSIHDARTSADRRLSEYAARWVYYELHRGADGWLEKAERLGLEVQGSSAVWSVVRVPTRLGGRGWPVYKTYRDSYRVLRPCRLRLPVGGEGVRLTFRVRRPRRRKRGKAAGTKPRSFVFSAARWRTRRSLNWFWKGRQRPRQAARSPKPAAGGLRPAGEGLAGGLARLWHALTGRSARDGPSPQPAAAAARGAGEDSARRRAGPGAK